MSCIITYKGRKYSEQDFIKYLKKNPTEFRIPLSGLFDYRQEKQSKRVLVSSKTIPLAGNEMLYKGFNLLSSNGKIKAWKTKSDDAVGFLNRLNSYDTDFLFNLVQVASGNYQIMISKKVYNSPFDKVVDRFDYFRNGNETSAKAILEDMLNNDPIPDLDDLAKRLLRYIESNDVKITLVDNLDQFEDLKAKYGDNLVGAYTEKNNEIFVINHGDAYRFKATILHEIIHALSAYTINSDFELKSKLTTLLEDARKKVARSGREFYGLENEKEFLAEAFTNKDFIKFLKSHKVEKATLWDKFVDFIRSIFGKSLYDVTDKVFEEILQSTEMRAEMNAISNEADKYALPEDFDESNYASIAPSGDPSIDSEVRTNYFNGSNTVDSRTALKKIALSNNNFSKLAKILLDYSDFNNAVLELVPVKSLVKDGIAVGSYSHEKNSIKIAEFAEHPDGNAAITILHEILHSYTTGYLLNVESNLTRDFYELFEYAKKNMDQNLYGMTDEFEFISEMFTNPEFVKEMQKLKPLGKGYMNLFEEFIEMIIKLIGIPVQETFYDEAIALMSNLFVEMSDLNYKLDVIEKNKKKDIQYSKSTIKPSNEEPVKKSDVQVSDFTWSRKSNNSYEVSSAGDKRFSALYAKLKDGRTIEEAYQLDIKGYRSQGNDWKLGKGKAPLRNISKEESWNEYKQLWKQYLNENPELEQDLRKKAAGKVLTDQFASTDVSQARALAEILNENKQSLSNQIYSQLGNKTKSENVILESWGNLKEFKEAISPISIVATRIKNSNEHFGNPFSHDPAGKTQGLIKTETIREAVEKYIDWVINSSDTRAEWIRQQINSGELKGLSILYYKELGEPSHATALDYLINKYDWSNQVQSQPAQRIVNEEFTSQEEDEIGELIFGVVEDDDFGYDEEYTQESESYTQQVIDEIEQEETPLEDVNPIYEKSTAYDRVDREYESKEVDEILRTMKFFLFYKNREVHSVRQLKLQDAVDGLQYLLNRYNPNGGTFPSTELYENVKRLLDPEVLEYFIHKLKADLKKIADIKFASNEETSVNDGEIVGLEDEEGNPILNKESYDMPTYMRATPMIRLIMSSMPEIVRLDEATGKPVFKTGGILNSFQTSNKDNLFKVVGGILKNFTPYDKDGNLLNSFDKMMDMLESRSNIHPELSYLVSVLRTSNIHIQTQFVRTFNNQRVNSIDHIRDNKTNVSKLAQSNNNTAAASILNEWAVSFVKSVRNADVKGAVYDETKLYNITHSISGLNLDYSDNTLSDDHFYNEYLNILNSMGIPITMKVLKNAINKNSELTTNRDRLKEFGNKLTNATKNLLAQAGKPISSERRYNYLLNETTFFRDILADAASDFVKSRGEDQIAGADGKPKSLIQHHNTLSKLVAEMKVGSTRYLRQLAEDPYSKYSYWLSEIYDYDKDVINPKYLREFELATFNILKLEGEGDKGSKFSDLNAPEQLLDTVVKYMSGYAVGLAEADKTQQFYFTLPNVYTSGFNFNGSILDRNFKFEPFALKYFKDQIYSEWERASTEEERLKQWKKAGQQHKEMKDYHYAKTPGDGKGNYKRIYLFAGLDEENLIELGILNKNGKVNRPDRFALDSNAWNNLIMGEFEKAVQYDLKTFVENGLINLLPDNSYQNNLISNELLDGNNPKNKLAYPQITNFVADFTFMSIMSNIEQTKMFNGDPAFYKTKGNDWFSDFIKRIPALTASGVQTVSREDLPKTYKSQVVKNVISPSEYFSDVENLEKIAQVTKRDLKEIKELFWGKPDKEGKYSGGYLDVNRTDAQAWISLDAWKTRLNYFGMWSDDHDIIFEKVKNKTPLTYSEKMIAMQPLKTVHVERVWKDKLPKLVYNKQSEALLLPELFENGEIFENLKKLESEGIDHLIVVDGRKVGASGIIDITDPNFISNPDELSYSHLMLQQELPTKGTKDILVGTQMIKNALLALQSGDVATYQEYLQVHSELSNQGLLKLKEELEYDDETKSYNKDVLYDKLIDAFEGEVSDNVILALKNRMSFDSILSIKEKVQNRLMSTINSSTVNLKANGMALILMSDFGTMQMSSINRNEIVGNGVILLEDRKVDELRPMRMDKKTGKVSPAEVLVPYTIVQKAFEKLGLDITKMTHKEITDLIDPRLLEGVGYRIPNQGPSSNAAIKIVGILPSWMGDTAIMSKEITTQMGSDFDIDKIFMILPEYWINDKQEGYVLNYIRPKTSLKEMNTKQLRNRRLELLRKIFLTPESFDKMMAPLDQDWLKDWVDENIPVQKKESKMSFWTGTHQTENKAMFDNAKTLVGTIANHMTHHAMMIHEAIEGLSNIKNKDGEDIAIVLSAYMNAIVDAAKDPYVSRANVNQYTAGLVFMLNRNGYNKFDVLAFINQPIIKELVKQVSINESRLNEDNRDTIKEIAIKYGMNPSYQLSDYIKEFDNKDLDGLISSIKQTTNGTLLDQMKAPNNETQLVILAIFNELQKSARSLNNFISTAKADVRGAGKNITQSRLISEAVEDLSDEFKTIFRDDHFIGTYHKNSVEFALDLLGGDFIESTNAFVDTVNYLINDRNVSINNSFEIDNINKELYGALLSEYDLFQIKDGVDYDSTIGEKPRMGFERFLSNFPKVVEKMKKRYPNNNLLQNLSIGTELETGMDYLYVLGNSLSSDLKLDLYKDWEDLLAFDEEFGENLIKYSFYTSGFRTSFGSFFQYIPTSWMMKEDGLDQFIKNKVKELNNPSYFKESNHLEKVAGHLSKNRYIFKNVPKDQVQLIDDIDNSDLIIALPKYNVRYTKEVAPNFIKRRVFTADLFEEDSFQPSTRPKTKTFMYYMKAGFNVKGDPIYKRIQTKGKSTPHISYKEYGTNFNASLFDIITNEYFSFTTTENIYLNSLLNETDAYITGVDSNETLNLEDAQDENKYCNGVS